MRRLISVLIPTLLLSGTTVSSAQVAWNWLNGGGGDSTTIPGQFQVYNEAMSVAIGTNNHIYITGTVAPPVEFGGQTLPAYGHNDIFAAHYDPSGTLLWAKTAGGNSSILTTNEECGKSIAVGTDGSAYIGGITYNTAQFGNITVNADPDPDGSFYIAKLSPAGDFQWVRTGEASDASTFDPNLAVCADDFDRVYLAAYTLNLKWLIDTFYAPPQVALFITQLDTAGNVNWNYFSKTGITVSLGSGYNNVDLATDAAGNIVYAASRPRLYQPSPSTNIYYPNLLLGKVDANGSQLWEKEFGDPMQDLWNAWATSVAISPGGDIYSGGYYLGDFLLDQMVTETAGGFVCRFDSAGNILKTRAIPGQSQITEIAGVEWMPGGIMVTGNFFDLTDFGGVQLSPIAPPLFDMFVALYDTALNLQQVTAYGYSRQDRMRASAANTTGQYAVCGSYTDSLAMGNLKLLPSYTGPAAHAFFFAAAAGTGTFVPQDSSIPTFRIYPNPAPGMTRISTSFGKPYNLMVMTMDGKRVFGPIRARGNLTLNLPLLDPGTYMVHLSGENWQHARRLTMVR